MARSTEYPDLLWIPPKSWTNANRTDVQLVIIHDTEGSENTTSAEDGASYDQRRTDGTSTHYFHDQNSTVQCVLTEDQAHAARTQGNRRGIQHELCGRASQGVTGWADAASTGTLQQAAKQVARDCQKWNIPARKLSAGQVASGIRGICGHADITAAFPADNGTHTDPGPTFPWEKFIGMVQAILNPERETDVTLADEQILITSSSAPLFTPGRTSAAASEFLALSAIYAKRANDGAAAAGVAIGTLANVVAGLDTVDEAALGSAIQAGLVPAISASVTAGVVAALADADVELTPELIQAQVEAGVRNVLGGLDAVPTV